MKRIIKISLIFLLVGMAVIVAVPFLKEKEAEKKSDNGFKEIQESVTDKKDKTINVEKLKGENKDCIGYLEVSGTTISYPVMQTKDNPDYYLNHDFNKNYSFYGTPYLSAYCDINKSDNLIIYGHHMKNGNMFGKLQNYEDEKFYRAHKAIVFDTVREHREYQVLSVFRGQAYAADDTEHFHYYDFTEARDQEDFEDYVEQITRRSQYQTGVTAEYGDELLTLSTCAYHKEEGRFVVVAKRVT